MKRYEIYENDYNLNGLELVPIRPFEEVQPNSSSIPFITKLIILLLIFLLFILECL